MTTFPTGQGHSGATNPPNPNRTANPSGNDGSGDLRAAEWQAGDPVHVEPPRRQHCLNAGCGTSWVGADVAKCPECGGLVGQAAVDGPPPPLCALDESNDMEAFAALPECLLCGGTGKQIPDGFWGIEAISDAMAERVGYAVRDALTATAAQDFDSPAAAWSAVGRAAVRALREDTP